VLAGNGLRCPPTLSSAGLRSRSLPGSRRPRPLTARGSALADTERAHRTTALSVEGQAPNGMLVRAVVAAIGCRHCWAGRADGSIPCAARAWGELGSPCSLVGERTAQQAHCRTAVALPLDGDRVTCQLADRQRRAPPPQAARGEGCAGTVHNLWILRAAAYEGGRAPVVGPRGTWAGRDQGDVPEPPHLSAPDGRVSASRQGGFRLSGNARRSRRPPRVEQRTPSGPVASGPSRRRPVN
jgi:hypothetical protein